MITIHSKSFAVTQAMREAVHQHFCFLPEEELAYVQLKLEQLNPHTLRIKILFQKPRQKAQTLEVLTKDFYKGLDLATKKFKVQANRSHEKRLSRHKKMTLGQAFTNELASPDAEEPSSLLEELDADVTEHLQIPIYHLSLNEAIEQLNCFNYTVLTYTDILDNTLCVLVRQPDGHIKRYVGIPS